MKFNKKVLIITAGAVVLMLVAVGIFFSKKSDGQKPMNVVANETVEFINQNLLTQGNTATSVSVVEDSGLYKLKLKVGTNEAEVYITKNGKLLFINGVIDMAPATTTGGTQTESGTTVQSEKSDRPDVKLFVMSYCPYGLQAEKMYLPVYNLLKDKADMGIYFVNYAMHGEKEITENLRQYCIQKEQIAKYADYLSCFVKAGDATGCLTSAKIDKTKLASCQTATDGQYKITANYEDKTTWLNGNYPVFNVDAGLNEQYKIQGSPTVVINGTVVNINPRSPEQFKQVICQAFNIAPAECSQSLSNDAASVSFGDSGSTSGGSCE